MSEVFVSYSHHQGDWVWGRLVPVLKASGAEVLIDRERFEAGRGLVGQMDAAQDQADRQLLVLFDDYLGSDYCRHELDRRTVSPSLTRCDWTCRATANREPWAKLLAACAVDLGADAPHWLAVRDRITRFLEWGQSVDLVVNGQVRWRTLLDHLRAEHFPELALVNLDKGSTARRRGLILEILNQLGHRPTLPDEPDDLAELDRLIGTGPRASVALTHFDQVAARPQYGIDLFAALRYLMMDARKLVLLVQSRPPFLGLLPRDHPLSEIDIKTVELQGTR